MHFRANKMSIFVHQGTPLVNCLRKHLEPKRKVFLKYTEYTQCNSHTRLNEIYFVTNLGHDDLRETAT